MLPILNDVQAAFGHVPDGAVPIVAEALNLSRAEVHGVVTFYHDLKRAPHGRPVVKLCRAEACQARGVDRIAPLLEGDERIEVETVYCLGLCASGPSAMVGERGLRAARRDVDSAAGRSRPGRIVGMKFFVPGDAAACAVGADEVAAELARLLGERGIDAAIVRNGSRGMFELEPLLEVETQDGRMGYARLSAADLPAVLDAVLDGSDHPSGVGLVDELPFLKRQTRLTFARCGITDPQSIDEYRAHGGLAGPRARHRHRPGRHGRGGGRLPACAAAAAPASRPASSGGPRRRRRPRRNISSATPTRATAAPSPTGW